MKKLGLLLLVMLFIVSACSPENVDVLPQDDSNRIEIQDEGYDRESGDEDGGTPPPGFEN